MVAPLMIIGQRGGIALLIGSAVFVGSSASADVRTYDPPELILESVVTVSTTAPDEETERASAHVHRALTENSDLSRCLDDVVVRRNAGSISATLRFERAMEPSIAVRTAGRLPAAARRCVETFTRQVRLWDAPSGTIVLRARFRVFAQPRRVDQRSRRTR